MIRVLIIEDNLEIRENVAELLELAGYEVISASDGEIGVRMAKQEIPHVILSDLMMPRLDGNGVFEALKNDDTTRNIPFIFITSSVERKMVQAAFEKGVSGYIKKPFEEKDLLDTILNCLKSQA